LSGLDRFGLFDIKPAEQPVQLTPGNGLSFRAFSWPTITSLRDAQPFIKENVSIWFVEQDLDPVTSFPTEQEQGGLVWVHRKFIPDNAAETIDGLSHISRAADDENVVGHRNIA